MGIVKRFFKDRDKKAVYNLFIALFVGVALLVVSQTFLKPGAVKDMSGDEQNAAPDTRISEVTVFSSLEQRLQEILSLVENAGAVRVMINYTQGPETVVAWNTTEEMSGVTETDANGGSREQNQSKTQSNVVTTRNKSGDEEPLVLYENMARVEGVIIVAEGGGDVYVRDALIRAASGLLGVAVHKITVLKMAPQ